MDYFVFIILAPLGITALLTAIASVWPHRHVPAARTLLLTGATVAGWLLFNIAEALSTTASAKLFWATLTYIFIATAPLAWLVFVLVYTNRTSWVRWERLAILTIIPAVTILLAFTNEAHGLIWRTYTFYEVPAPAFSPFRNGFLGMKVVHGPWYLVYAVFAYACLLISSLLMIHERLRSFTIYRRQFTWMVCAVLSPLVANFVYLSGTIPGLQKDYAPLAFALGTGIFTLNTRRFGLLDLKPIARNLLIDKMRDGMLVLDSVHRIVDLNPEAATIFGLDADRVIGRPVASVLGSEYDELTGHLNGTVEEQVELCLSSDAGKRFYELRVTPLTNSGGHLTGRLLILHDITLHKQHEEMLQLANQQLESEYEELDAFSHMVAHDLKNPVQTILGFSEILEEDDDDLPDESRREAILTIGKTALKMEQIIRELLLLASIRRQSVPVQQVDMAGVVAEVLERFHSDIEQQDARVTAADTWPVVFGYAPWIEEVWSNYVGNALKYAGPHPRIELGWNFTEGGAARFWVRDFGPGVPPHKQDQLFVPFTRLGQPATEGHGLGLSIVHRIMERLGGGFGVESSGIPGEGSTFYFTLPLAPAHPAPGKSAEATPHDMLLEAGSS